MSRSGVASLGLADSLAPSQFEAGFTSTAHTPDVIDATIQAARNAFQMV